MALGERDPALLHLSLICVVRRKDDDRVHGAKGVEGVYGAQLAPGANPSLTRRAGLMGHAHMRDARYSDVWNVFDRSDQQNGSGNGDVPSHIIIYCIARCLFELI